MGLLAVWGRGVLEVGLQVRGSQPVLGAAREAVVQGRQPALAVVRHLRARAVA